MTYDHLDLALAMFGQEGLCHRYGLRRIEVVVLPIDDTDVRMVGDRRLDTAGDLDLGSRAGRSFFKDDPAGILALAGADDDRAGQLAALEVGPADMHFRIG